MFQTRNFEQFVINALPIIWHTFHYPQQLEHWHERANSFWKASKKSFKMKGNGKIEFRFFSAAFRNSPTFESLC